MSVFYTGPKGLVCQRQIKIIECIDTFLILSLLVFIVHSNVILVLHGLMFTSSGGHLSINPEHAGVHSLQLFAVSVTVWNRFSNVNLDHQKNLHILGNSYFNKYPRIPSFFGIISWRELLILFITFRPVILSSVLRVDLGFIFWWLVVSALIAGTSSYAMNSSPMLLEACLPWRFCFAGFVGIPVMKSDPSYNDRQ